MHGVFFPVLEYVPVRTRTYRYCTCTVCTVLSKVTVELQKKLWNDPNNHEAEHKEHKEIKTTTEEEREPVCQQIGSEKGRNPGEQNKCNSIEDCHRVGWDPTDHFEIEETDRGHSIPIKKRECVEGRCECQKPFCWFERECVREADLRKEKLDDLVLNYKPQDVV